MATIDGLPYVINGIEVFNNKRVVIDRVAVDAAAEDYPETKVLEQVRYGIKRVSIFSSHASTVSPVFALPGQHSPGQRAGVSGENSGDKWCT
ncbi:hypothetical protein A3730_26495 [Alcanivorax sp. HI0044]|nr:hypothetical protein A3730_26495 [Alcanivorax sp. HI0044]